MFLHQCLPALFYGIGQHSIKIATGATDGSIMDLKLDGGFYSKLQKPGLYLPCSLGPEGGLSLDSEPADKEPKNQTWLF